MGRILVKDGLYKGKLTSRHREQNPNYQYLTLCVIELVILEIPLGWACSCVYVTMKLVISVYINGSSLMAFQNKKIASHTDKKKT